MHKKPKRRSLQKLTPTKTSLFIFLNDSFSLLNDTGDKAMQSDYKSEASLGKFKDKSRILTRSCQSNVCKKTSEFFYAFYYVDNNTNSAMIVSRVELMNYEATAQKFMVQFGKLRTYRSIIIQTKTFVVLTQKVKNHYKTREGRECLGAPPRIQVIN